MATSTYRFKLFMLFVFSVLFLLSTDVSAVQLRHHFKFNFDINSIYQRIRNHNFNCDINAIYQLGYSISDTGNLIREPIGAIAPFAHLPYGETFFNRSTGRCSNGLLMVDFLASAVGLPLINPYMDKEASFDHGVNFAVAGSTALESSFLATQKILSPVTNSSLLVQLERLKSHFNSTCNTKIDCTKKLEKALFMVGEIGGNDYNYALSQRKTIEETKNIVPNVIQNIMKASKEVIDLGATRVIVPGNFPIGCLPIYLTKFKSNELNILRS